MPLVHHGMYGMTEYLSHSENGGCVQNLRHIRHKILTDTEYLFSATAGVAESHTP